MITMAEAYGWLNQGDVSHLSTANQLSLIQIEDRRIPKEHRETVVQNLHHFAESTQRQLETLEIRLALARLEFESGDLNSAKLELIDAVNRYSPSSHRLAVAKWMLGIVLWKLHENDAAYMVCTQALEIMVALAAAAVRSHNVEMNLWYIQRIDAMRLDLTNTAEEAVYWLNYFDPTHLSESARMYVEQMRKKIRAKEYPLAYEVGRSLLRISNNRVDPLETAEAWVMIGLAAYQMGNPRQAIEYWQRGAAAYNPWGHQQACTRWMLGAAMWQIPSEHENAVRNWVNAIEAFDNLRVKADRDNIADKKAWYETSIRLMRQALKNRVEARS